MDIITYSSELESKMRQKLEEILMDTPHATDQSSLTARRIAVIAEFINTLHDFTRGYKFAGISEEIKFFKEIKPVFLSQYFFHKEVYAITLTESFMEDEGKRRYYNSILQGMLRHSRRHHEFYLYCMTSDTSKDNIYFTQFKDSVDPLRDPRFSSERDELLAQILSHTMLKDYLTGAIEKLSLQGNIRSKLVWTGKKLDLVELIFAIHATGSVNNAETGIKPLAKAFEETFNIDLGNYHDYLQSIRGRKKTKLTFLETMKSKLQSRFDQFDEA